MKWEKREGRGVVCRVEKEADTNVCTRANFFIVTSSCPLGFLGLLAASAAAARTLERRVELVAARASVDGAATRLAGHTLRAFDKRAVFALALRGCGGDEALVMGRARGGDGRTYCIRRSSAAQSWCQRTPRYRREGSCGKRGAKSISVRGGEEGARRKAYMGQAVSPNGQRSLESRISHGSCSILRLT